MELGASERSGLPSTLAADIDVLTFRLLTALFLPVLALVVVAGVVLARRRLQRAGATWNSSKLESSLIGVYGFLLSFGFYLSGTVHRESTELVHEQSAELAMLHREASLLPPADAEAVHACIRGILSAEVKTARTDDEARSVLEAECSRAYDKLWDALVVRAVVPGAQAMYRPSLDHAQRAIALEYRLRFSELERVPRGFLLLLVSGALFVGFLIGFTSGSEGHGWLVPLIFVVLAGSTIVTILDLNDPWHGFLRPSKSNYEQLLQAVGG